MSRAYVVGLPARRGLDAAARDRLPQLAARRAGGRRHALGGGRLDPVQLHALLFPRGPRARRATPCSSSTAILPLKPVSELFTVLGRAKQGKTERFREIFRHLERTQDRFVRAPGERGLVMACFALEHADVIFKVIRDRFPAVKNVRREEVMAKYDMVFRHDRAGRLVDAQEFRRIRLPTARFAPDMLEELLVECSENVQRRGRGPHRQPRLHRAADDAAQPVRPERVARAGGARRDRLRAVHPRPRLHRHLRRATCCSRISA